MKNTYSIAILMASIVLAPPVFADSSITIRGWLEHVLLPEVAMKMDAKLDTGAKTSSIGAEILSDNNHSDTVTFRIANEDGEERTLEREVVRTVKIKMRGGGTEERKVVELEVCLGIQRIKGEFSLADRSNFNYPVLIGRSLLEDASIAVRSDEEYVDDPDC